MVIRWRTLKTTRSSQQFMMKSSKANANRPSFQDYNTVRVFDIIHRIAVHTTVKPSDSPNPLGITGDTHSVCKVLPKIRRGLNMIALYCSSIKELDTYVGSNHPYP